MENLWWTLVGAFLIVSLVGVICIFAMSPLNMIIGLFVFIVLTLGYFIGQDIKEIYKIRKGKK